jgi:hypothetical protein
MIPLTQDLWYLPLIHFHECINEPNSAASLIQLWWKIRRHCIAESWRYKWNNSRRGCSETKVLQVLQHQHSIPAVLQVRVCSHSGGPGLVHCPWIPGTEPSNSAVQTAVFTSCARQTIKPSSDTYSRAQSSAIHSRAHLLRGKTQWLSYTRSRAQ